MSGVKLYTSNRLEILIEKLADKISSQPLCSPLTGEIIIVQSKGMERWISMELARRHGVCANCHFPFPNNFAHQVFQEFIDDLPDETGFNPDFLTWKIMKQLPVLLNRSEFNSLKSYLHDDGEGLKLYQLSRRIADTFDQYLIFRPEMILGWKNKIAENWQVILWQKVIGDQEITHRAALREIFLERVKDGSHKISNLPERVSVFGISALPPFHIGILYGLSFRIEVNLFLMNPCREYWEDIVSDWETDKISRRNIAKSQTISNLHFEKGNSLLASMGALGRDFFSLINELDVEENSFIYDSEPHNMLSFIQSDILNLTERGKQPDEIVTVSEDDYSIQLHSCHSPMREIEVLYDNLLDMFDDDPELMPKDVLVMTPDIELYAPYIQAIFDKSSGGVQNIPYTIADRSLRNESPVIDSFMSILGLSGSRFTASEVMSALESPYVFQKFKLTIDEVELIRHWVENTRIRWGINSDHRSVFGLPSQPENTWQAGLERLLIGYAMPGNNEKLFDGILPYDEIEGENTLTLGKFAEFTDKLFSSVNSLNENRSLNEWAKTLNSLFDKLIYSNDETEREVQEIRKVCSKLIELEEKSGFNGSISLDVIKAFLKNEFENTGFSYGFVAGSVSFCAMLPMRSIPFKVICIIGLNNDAYPRQVRPLSFDLMAKKPKRGDRSCRNDDRYLFLEAILSARSRFYISYVGQNISDNSEIPPSVVTSELLDYIEKGFKLQQANILDHIETKHRLQAFNPEYFSSKSILFSFSDENCRASRIMTGDRFQPEPFVARGFAEPDNEYKRISIEQLCSFFKNPAKYLLKHRLGINLERYISVLEDREPYDVEGLEKYGLEDNLLYKQLKGENIKEQYDIIKARGMLPHGTPGRCLYDEFADGIMDFSDRINSFASGDILQPLEIDLNIAGFKITGRIEGIYPDGLIQYRIAGVKPKDLLRAWLYHLLLNIQKPASYPDNSIYIGNDKVCDFIRVDNGETILKQLLESYWSGMIKPLSFFPESSYAYAKNIYDGNAEDYSISKAENAWYGGNHNRGEIEDEYFRLCFGNVNPFDDEFKRIARQIYEPLLTASDKKKLS